MLWVSVSFVLVLVLSVLSDRDDDAILAGKSQSSSISNPGGPASVQVNVHVQVNGGNTGSTPEVKGGNTGSAAAGKSDSGAGTGAGPACSIADHPTQCEAGATPAGPEGTMADLRDKEFGKYPCKGSPCTANDAEEATKNMYALGMTPPPDVPAEFQGKRTVMPGVEYPEFKKLEHAGPNTRVLRIDLNVGRKCPCIGHGQHVDGLATWASFTSDDGAYLVAYPADFGFNCKAWDLNRHPACRVSDKVPDWCFKPWCYVDRASCHDESITDYEDGSYFNWNEGDGFIKKMQYSWQRCDESLEHTEGPSSYATTGLCEHMGHGCEDDPRCAGKCKPAN